jgi:hypothetical protein
MSLDGLRAWIGEVERKLGRRTRVFLVLAVIAIGGAGAAIYLAIDTRDNAVSESDVQALQQELETQIATGGAGGGSALTQLEAEVDALKAEVEGTKGEGGGGASGGSGKGASGTGTSGSPPPASSQPGSAAELGEVLQKAKEASEKAEGK